MLELGLALVAALGSVLTAYVAYVIPAVRRQTNGRLDELHARLSLVEEILQWSRFSAGVGDPERVFDADSDRSQLPRQDPDRIPRPPP